MSVFIGLIPYFNIILTVSLVYGLNPVLIGSQIAVESNFNPYAVSRAGAIGLMQIMPRTAEWLGFIDSGEEELLLDPVFNVRVGCHYNYWLKRYWAKKGFAGYKLLVLMLASYNAGPGRVRKALEGDELNVMRLPYETRHYIRKVTSSWAWYLLEACFKLAEGAKEE